MITLPLPLITQIESLISDRLNLQEGYKSLSRRYHGEKETRYLRSDDEVLAYLAARLPATYAAILAVCSPLAKKIDIQSITDLGSGPGTALLALTSLWPGIQTAEVIEHNEKLLFLNRLLNPIQKTRYQHGSVTDGLDYPESDMVALSYVLNELPEISSIVERAWRATKKCLVIVEPGTPDGFRGVLQARNQLIEAGGFIAAPCPHHNRCPLSAQDWCHFSVRLERPALHRHTKNGRLMYEDEKYSYLIVTREPVERPAARVLTAPLHRPGHTRLDLCTETGLKRPVLSKKIPALYRQVKKVSWGSPWEQKKGESPIEEPGL